MKRIGIVAAVAVLICGSAAFGQDQGLSLFQRAQQQADLERQQTDAKVHELLAGVDTAIANARWSDATLRIETARRLVKTADEMSADQKADLMARVDAADATFGARRAEYEQAQTQKTQQEIAEREKQRRLAEQLFEERQVDSKWANLREHESRQQYDQAVATAESILQQRPNDTEARLALWDNEYRARLAAEIAVRNDRRRETQATLADTEASAIPYTDIYRYPNPREWERMSVRRLSHLARQLGYETEEGVSEAQLEKRIDLNVSDVSLSNVLIYLSEAAGIPIVTDPHIQTDIGVDPTTDLVTLNVRQLTLRQILDMIMPEDGGWRVAEGNIIVSSQEKANPLKTITYPIQHLVAEVPDFGEFVPRMNLADALTQGGSGSGGGGGVSLFEDTTTTTGADGALSQDRIKELIVRFVKGPRVGVWEDLGGTATIDYYSGTLIISQTEEGHRKVAALLAKL